MVVSNKWIEIFQDYRKVLRDSLNTGGYLGQRKKSVRTKNALFDFFLQHNRWPSRKSLKIREKKLGIAFENYMSRECAGFDEKFRNIVMATGRVSNHKRKHNIKGFKEEIVNFMKEHGRVPTSHNGAVVTGEGSLRNKLDYYVKVKHDMSFLGTVYKFDKCHRSGVPAKVRKIINQNIELDRPLIRLIREE